MSGAAAKGTNGKRTDAVACRHSPGCPVVQEQRDLRVIVERGLEEMSKARAAIEETAQLVRMTLEQHEVNWSEIVANDIARYEEHLKQEHSGATVAQAIEGLTAQVRRLLPEEV